MWHCLPCLQLSDADEPLTVSSLPYDLDPVVDMVISSVGLLEPDLLTPIAALDMCSFQSVFLPSSEDLLEAMTEVLSLDMVSFQSIVLLEAMIKKRLSMVF
jgi:hypothetical protein